VEIPFPGATFQSHSVRANMHDRSENHLRLPGYMKGDFTSTQRTPTGFEFLQDHDVHEQQSTAWMVGEQRARRGVSDRRSGALVTAGFFDPLDANIARRRREPIIAASTTGGTPPHQSMWRWQSMRDYSLKDVLAARTQYGKTASSCFLRVERARPTSTAPWADRQPVQRDAELQSHRGVRVQVRQQRHRHDRRRVGRVLVEEHEHRPHKSVEAAQWLQTNYRTQSYLVFAHPEREELYAVADFRDLNNAAPGRRIRLRKHAGPPEGNEGASQRGEYMRSSKTDGHLHLRGTGIYAGKSAASGTRLLVKAAAGGSSRTPTARSRKGTPR